MFDPNKGKSEELDLAVFNPLSQEETVSMSYKYIYILFIYIVHLHERDSRYIILVDMIGGVIFRVLGSSISWTMS